MTEIDKAYKILKENGVVGIPTETVYGLAASIQSQAGINRIFELKERPFFDPLIVHVNSITQAKEYVSNWSPLCELLANHFWPGPLTLILTKKNSISDKITSGLKTVAIRMPSNKKTLELITRLGHPLAAPSANKFTKTSPTKLIDVTSVFPDLFVIDGGKCTVGIESTILEILHNQIKIYRPGMISKQEINTLLSQNNIPATISYHESPIAPGSLKHHYMPKTPIITTLGPLHEQDTSSLPKHLLQKTASWKLPINAAIAAREIYGHFRKLDQQETTSMIIEITPKQRIDDHFKGILNRLFKASSYFLPEDLVEES